MKFRPATSRSIALSVLLTALGAGLPAIAWAATPVELERGNYRGQCRRLSLQIDHFENTVLPMAVQRGNRAWEEATEAQVERLWHRRADLCPQYAAERSMMRRAADRMRKFNQMIATAARAAATYFSGGVAGGMP